MADFGVKVSLPGKSVYSTEPRDFVFHSKFGSVKVVQESPNKTYETTVISAAGSNTITIPHNLGFIPLCMVFVELNPGSGRWYNGISLPGPDDVVGVYPYATSYTDSTNLYLVITNTSGSSKTVKYYYYIFGDDGV